MSKIRTNDSTAIALHIRNEINFETHGALRGEYRDLHDYGIVYSYAEPIALYYPKTGKALITGLKFSATTSQHTLTTRSALSLLGYEVTEAKDRIRPS